MYIEDILDELPDSQERARRKLLMKRAFAGEMTAREALRNDYGLTYIFKRGEGEVYL